MIAMISQRPEDVLLSALRSVYRNTQHSALRSIRRRHRSLPKPLATRCLSTLPRSNTCTRPLGAYMSPKNSGGPRELRQTFVTTSANYRRREIAVIGAGITGLTAAHYLARYAEDAHITIYEASDRPGGWIKADRVEVEDEEGRKGHVLFQRGPRMLRSSSTSMKYDDLVLYDVLASLDMTDEIQHPKGVSDNRYLYYPDHLVKLPTQGNILEAVTSFLTEPLWSGLFGAALHVLRSRNTQGLGSDSDRELYEETGMMRDESVAEFVTRITGEPRLVDNILSGMMHGIYGGDVHKLSAKQTVLEKMWYFRNYPVPRDQQNKMQSLWSYQDEWYLVCDLMMSPNRLKIIELAEHAVDWKLLAFEDGLVSLVRGLARDLQKKSNVTFKLNSPVTSLEHKKGEILVTTPSSARPIEHDHVICTLFSKQLSQITKPANSMPSLAETHAVTIMVVNLWYPNPDLLSLRTEGGFGYLIPQSTPDNDECVLGVLFDSDLKTSDAEIPGTKLTVMLGGHYWDGWQHLPTEEMGTAMAKEVVRRHLGIGEEEKVVASARLCRECLPQHYVGHRSRMRQAHDEIMSTFKGRLTVAGPSYTGIGVMPAMRAGFDAGMRVARGHPQPWFRDMEDLPAGATYLDWWKYIPKFTNHAEVRDMVGASGLERFKHREGDRIIVRNGNKLPFRKTTHQKYQFRDKEGRYLTPDRRKGDNCPLEKGKD